jgi:hypothetical protein
VRGILSHLRNVDALLRHLAGVEQALDSGRYPHYEPKNAVLGPTTIVEIVCPCSQLSFSFIIQAVMIFGGA